MDGDTTEEQARVQPRGRRHDRRWLMSAIGGAAAGFTVARLVKPSTALAADGEDIELGTTNHASSETVLRMAEGSDPIGLHVNFVGISNSFTGHRVGVLGEGIGTVGAGLLGRNISGQGVLGEGSPGVRGVSDDGVGVHGSTTGEVTGTFTPSGGRFSTTASNSVGGHALVQAPIVGAAPTNSIALLAEAPGENLAAKFVGAVAFLGNFEVSGDIDLQGLLQATAAPGGSAARFVGPTEIYGTLEATAPPGGTAARFVGPTEFAGDLSAAGSLLVAGEITQTIVPPGGGAPVPSFAIQALAAWLEDYGSVPMAGQGQVRVTLGPEFVAVADVSDYHVFIQGIGGDTPQVSQKDATGFTVKAQNANKAPESISYRVVGRRL